MKRGVKEKIEKLKEREIKNKKPLKEMKDREEDVLSFEMITRSPDIRNFYERYRDEKEKTKRNP